jgi:hypothetical protein
LFARIDQAVRAIAPQLRRHVGEDHDRKLEALGLVHRHQPHAVAALFENRRFGRLAAIRLLAQFFDEASERQPPPNSYWRASSATWSTLASACCPAGRSTNPTCARVALSSCVIVSPTGR